MHMITLVHGPDLGWREQFSDYWFRRVVFVVAFVLGFLLGRIEWYD